jgi:hypothetical protein
MLTALFALLLPAAIMGTWIRGTVLSTKRAMLSRNRSGSYHAIYGSVGEERAGQRHVDDGAAEHAQQRAAPP